MLFLFKFQNLLRNLDAQNPESAKIQREAILDFRQLFASKNRMGQVVHHLDPFQCYKAPENLISVWI